MDADRLLRTLSGPVLQATPEEVADILWLWQIRERGRRQLRSKSGRVQSDPDPRPLGDGNQPDTAPPSQTKKAKRDQRPPAKTSADTGLMPPSAAPIRGRSRMGRGQSVSIARASALPKARELHQAIAPLRRRLPAWNRLELDVEATAERYAEERIFTGVWRPMRVRWRRLQVLVDDSRSMVLWRQAVEELVAFFRHSGVFQSVEVWRVRRHATQAGRMTVSRGLNTRFQARPASAVHVSGISGAMVLLTDCLDVSWRNGAMPGWLENLGRHHALTVLHVLPERLWSRSGLLFADFQLARATNRGTPNRDLVSVLASGAWGSGNGGFPGSARVRTPVVPVSQSGLLRWASLLCGRSEFSVPTFSLPLAKRDVGSVTQKPEASVGGEAVEPAKLWRAFQANASPAARQLFRFLAAAPLSLPVMRLIQCRFCPASDHGHLAEVLMGGLVVRFGKADWQDLGGDPDQLTFEFRPGVREFLLDGTRVESAVSVQLALSDYLEERFGKERCFSFRAYYEDPDNPAGEGVPLASDQEPFARVALEVLRRMGSRYARAARSLGAQIESPDSVETLARTQVPRFGFEFVSLPAGEFRMGSPQEEPDRFDREGPQHDVVISEAFQLAITPVTQGQYQSVVGENPSLFKHAGADAPVESVSWEDAVAFCRRLNELTPHEGGPPEGSHYSLPTEVQWEYACRAGSQSALYCGNITLKGAKHAPELDGVGWYGGNSGVDYKGAYDSSGWAEKQYPHKQAGTHPVGQKQPNRWGLFDMIGNVLEWCADGQRRYYEEEMLDPIGSTKNAGRRVVRGGSWLNDASVCRCAYRRAYSPDYRFSNLGFRLALQLGPARGIWRPGSPGSREIELEPAERPVPDLFREGRHALFFGWTRDEIESVSKSLCDSCGYTSVTSVPYDSNWQTRWQVLERQSASPSQFLVVSRAGGPIGPSYLRNLWFQRAESSGGSILYVGEADHLSEIEEHSSAASAVGFSCEVDPLNWVRYGLAEGFAGIRGNASVTLAEWDSFIERTIVRSWPGGELGGRLGELQRAISRESVQHFPARDGRRIEIGDNPRYRRIALDGQNSLEFLWVPPGSFLMGASSDDSDGTGDERPQHEVALSNGFWIGKYPVHQAAFSCFKRDHDCFFKGARRPVNQVSWFDAQSFVDWLNQRTLDSSEYRFRLPTEAEWEYACRAGTRSPFGVGDGGSLEGLAKFGSSDGSSDIGSFAPNPWGLYDCHGNVYEWCQDGEREFQSKRVVDPTGPIDEEGPRVVRGGGWFNVARGCRSAHRGAFSPDYRRSLLGFRLAL